MKELISECPNITPVGLGNGDSTVDMYQYAGGYKLESDDNGTSKQGTDFTTPEPIGDLSRDDDDLDLGEGDEFEDDDTPVIIPQKRPAGVKEKEKKPDF